MNGAIRFVLIVVGGITGGAVVMSAIVPGAAWTLPEFGNAWVVSSIAIACLTAALAPWRE